MRSSTRPTSIPQHGRGRLRSGISHIGSWHHHTVLVATVFALAVPYGVLGPGYFREDWVSLANAQVNGSIGAAGELVATTRPGAALVYAVWFGLLGGQLVVAWLLLVLLHAVAVVLVYELARGALGDRRAALVVFLWTLVPTHASLTHWISAVHISVALILVLSGVLAARRLADGQGSPWAPAALLFASGLFYESLLPAALVALAFIALSTRRWRALGPAFGAVVAAAGWSFVIGFIVAEKAPLVWASPQLAISANLGWGLFDLPQSMWLQLALILWTTYACLRLLLPGFRHTTAMPERLTAVGAVLVVVGLAPFLPFGADVDFTGLGDRANVIPSLGVAFILVGLGEGVVSTVQAARTRRALAVGLVGCLIAALVPARLQQDREWAAVWSWQKNVLRESVDAYADRGHVRIGYSSIGNRAIEGLNGGWDGSAALQWWTQDTQARVVYLRDIDEPVDVEVEPLRPALLDD